MSKYSENDKNRTFEFFYSLASFIFGFGMIFLFILAVGYVIYIVNFAIFFSYFTIALALIVLSAIIGGLAANRNKGYEIELKEKDSKKIGDVLDVLHKKTKIKKPHKITLREGIGIAVSGLNKKELMIGLATLRLLNKQDLLAIISHEYGHFYRKDTVLGYFNYRIFNFYQTQREAYTGSWLTFPLLLLFEILIRYQTLINSWCSKRIEFSADEFASTIVGKQQFADSFTKYVIISEIFENLVPQVVLHNLKEERAFVNLYKSLIQIYNEKHVKIAFDEVIKPKSKWSSSHPSVSERLEKLGVEKVNFEINPTLTKIIDNQEKYEEEASKIMTQKMAYWEHLARVAEAQRRANEE